jgi:hypothetical protein
MSICMEEETIRIVSSDGVAFVVHISVASLSRVIKEQLECEGDRVIELPDHEGTLTAEVIGLVVDFMNHYHTEKMNEIPKVYFSFRCYLLLFCSLYLLLDCIKLFKSGMKTSLMDPTAIFNLLVE